MVLFLFLSTTLLFETEFDYGNTMQYIDYWLGDCILIGSAYNIQLIGIEPFLGLVTFK